MQAVDCILLIFPSALIELEYLVHQIDNGYDFEQLNGFEIVLGIIDGGLDNNLVKKSARVISAATQANAKGKIYFKFWVKSS